LFHDTYKAFPPARYQPRPGDAPEYSCGGTETTWLVRIMPYLEQAAASERWDLSQPYNDHPEQVRTKTLPVYYCPSRRSASETVGNGLLAVTTTTWVFFPCGCGMPVQTTGSILVPGAVGDYGGNHGDLSPGSYGLPTDFYYGGNGTGVIISSRARCEGGVPVDWIDRVSHRDILDGLSQTLLAGEMHVPVGKLGLTPQDAFIFNGDQVFNFSRIGGPTVPIATDIQAEGNSLVAWGSWHPGTCHFAFSDSSVRSLNTHISTDVLGRLSHRSDGRVLSGGY
jgi:hypothetical protein